MSYEDKIMDELEEALEKAKLVTDKHFSTDYDARVASDYIERLLANRDIAARDQRIAELEEALGNTLKEHDRHICTHEETHRGGAIWEICDHCGQMWADDEGGFQPYEDTLQIAKARQLLTDRDSDQSSGK